MCTLQSLCLHYNIYVYSTISMCTLQSLMYTTISMVLHHRSQTFVRCRCCCEFIEIVTLRCHSLWTRQWINGSFGKSFPWNKIDNTFVAMFLFGIFARSAVSVTRCLKCLSIFCHLQQRKLAQKHTEFSKVGSKVRQIQIKP